MKTSVIAVRDMLSVLSVPGVEKRIGEVPGVESVTVNYAAGSATVRYDETRLDIADIKSGVRQRGYGYESDAPAVDSAGNGHEGHTAPGAPPVTPAPAPTSAAPRSAPDDSAAVLVPAAPGVDGHTAHSASDAPPPRPPPAMAKTGSLDDPSVKDADEVARAFGADI